MDFSVSFVAVLETLEMLKRAQINTRKKGKGAAWSCETQSRTALTHARCWGRGPSLKTSQNLQKDKWRSAIICSRWNRRGRPRVDAQPSRIRRFCWQLCNTLKGNQFIPCICRLSIFLLAVNTQSPFLTTQRYQAGGSIHLPSQSVQVIFESCHTSHRIQELSEYQTQNKPLTVEEGIM